MLLPLRVLALLTLLAWSSPAQAQSFPLDQWLDEPDVKLVAVEFYADWCEPCKEAAPRWEKLRQTYASQGLKLVVVNTRAQRPGCPKLPWNPDESLCDPKGQLADSLGVDDLPSAFLWSWQGNLLVDRGGHVEDVDRAVRTYLETNPRVQVVAKNAEGAEDLRLKRLFEAELSREGKLTVVADEEMRERLSMVRKESWDPGRSDRQRCKLGEEVSANSIFSVEIQGEELAVRLINAVTGCQRGIFAPWNPDDETKSAAKAVRRLLGDLKHRPAKMPRASAPPPVAPPTEPMTPTAPTPPPPEETEPGKVKVKFVSSSGGTRWDLLLNDEAVCTTPCTRWVDPWSAFQLRSRKKKGFFTPPSDTLDIPDLPTDQGDLLLRANPTNRGLLSLGITFTTLGAAAFITGIPLAAVGRADDDGGLATAGTICLGAGAAVVTGSIIMMVKATADYDIRPMGTTSQGPHLTVTPTGLALSY